MTALTNPEHIARFRLYTLRQALRLEIMGMRHSSGTSALSILRKEGLVTSRTRKEALRELDVLLGREE